MHKRFDHKEIEKKWQKQWAADGLYDVGDRDDSKEKEYVLVELPYPSGNLHIGHWYAFGVPDIYVRYQRMQGKQVVYPIGFDAFGLPAENAAIKRDVNPREWTESNIDYMKKQLNNMGNAFSWDKTASTIDPNYYKWTQWMFTQFFENNIAYRGEGVVNWCPHDNTVIANEQVLSDGTCERCGNTIEKRTMPQWMLRITDYADALIDDLDELDWPEFIKESQRNWIGRSKGAKLDFKLRNIAGQDDDKHTVTVFTTRPDTLFGATFIALSPELAQKWIDVGWEASDEVRNFIQTELVERGKKTFKEDPEKRGVDTGITAVNPANGEEIPVWLVNYVLGDVGTGAIMAVPAHDERDHAFATKFGIAIKSVISPVTGTPQENPTKRKSIVAIIHNPKTNKYLTIDWKDPKLSLFVGGGIDENESPRQTAEREIKEETHYTNFKYIRETEKMTHSYFAFSKNVAREIEATGFLFELVDEEESPQKLEDDEKELFEVNWKTAAEIEKLIVDELHLQVWKQLVKGEIYTGAGTLLNSGKFDGMPSEEAKLAITEALGGEMTSTYRLRDWSIGRQRYWGVPIPIVYDPDGKAHPIPKEHLPWTLPNDVDFKPTGEPPLAKSEELKKRTIEIFGEGWTPEVETMDTFVDSSWYFMRYLDNQNDQEFCSRDVLKNWMPIDLYFGGAEHTTMHLLYSRFWIKALQKLGLVTFNEPYTRRINRSLILGPDGNKMSKSKGNVVDPDEHVERVGADTVKMYLAFMGPYGEVNHYPFDLGGIAGIRRFLERVNGLFEHVSDPEPEEMTRALHKMLKKITEDISDFKFNTAISEMMIYVNTVEKSGLSKESYRIFLRVLAPFAPHLTEDLWHAVGNTSSIHSEHYPVFDAALATDTEVTIGVQINGKLRGEITVAPTASEEEVLKAVNENPNLKDKLESGEVKKVIYVPGRILNIIIGG